MSYHLLINKLEKHLSCKERLLTNNVHLQVCVIFILLRINHELSASRGKMSNYTDILLLDLIPG